MVVIVKTQIRNRQAFDRVNNKIIKLPKDIADAGHEFARLMQRNLRLNLTKNQTIWRRNLWNSIQAKRRSKFMSEVVMAQYGIWLDRAKPHYVSLKRGRLITLWAMQKCCTITPHLICGRLKSGMSHEDAVMTPVNPYSRKNIKLDDEQHKELMKMGDEGISFNVIGPVFDVCGHSARRIYFKNSDGKVRASCCNFTRIHLDDEQEEILLREGDKENPNWEAISRLIGMKYGSTAKRKYNKLRAEKATFC